MVLQCFSDCTLIDESGTTRLTGPGEVVTFPLHEALKVMIRAYEHFKILDPTPLLPGVAVCWSVQPDRVKGPGIVQLAEGNPPNRLLSVLIDGELLSIHEGSITDIDPWPAIHAKLGETWPYLLIDGEESPKVIAAQEWVFAHFDEDRDLWQR